MVQYNVLDFGDFLKSFFYDASYYNVLSKHDYKTSFGEFQPKNMYFRCFLCAAHLPACPNFRSTCVMALQHEFEGPRWLNELGSWIT